ncbi:MAG TPA: type II toxin-antitoxin system RelE/ParE family toxin [Pirellulales bacterium]|nr:type II toxin-antitoxin system RelE/ParE family toxin [Pirellulales bacterium]
MSQPAIEVHSAAAEDVRKAKRWYRAQSPDAKDRFVAELDAAMARVLSEPLRWPEYLNGTRRYRLRRFPYLVVYRVSGSVVQIVAVAHTSRRPGYWRKRRFDET